MTLSPTQLRPDNRQVHWNQVYTEKAPTEVSWYEEDPHRSLEWIRKAAPDRRGRIVDVGGGASVLVDRLLDEGYGAVTVVDISAQALETARLRLGARAHRVQWWVGDITRTARLPAADVWHDRAVFHFLTEEADRCRYVALAERTVPSGGHLIVAAFAPEGPDRCSGLPVCRYDAGLLADTIGPAFSLEESLREVHPTPWGSEQHFVYCRFRRR